MVGSHGDPPVSTGTAQARHGEVPAFPLLVRRLRSVQDLGGVGEQRDLAITSSRKPPGLPLFYMRMQQGATNH